jgi:hypothetical protein
MRRLETTELHYEPRAGRRTEALQATRRLDTALALWRFWHSPEARERVRAAIQGFEAEHVQVRTTIHS